MNKQPLGATNTNVPASTGAVSKLPQPGSRLRPPMASRLKPPTTVKRPLAVDQQDNVQSQQKRSRIEPPTSRPTRAGMGKPKATNVGGARSKTTTTSRPTTNGKRTTGVTRTTTRAAPPRAKPAVSKPAPSRGTSKVGATNKTRTTAVNSGSTAASGGGKAKRPAWDLKGRLEDMEKEMRNRGSKNSALEDMINGNNDRIQQLENLNSQLKGTVAQKEEQTSEASETIRQLRRKLQESEDELATSSRRFQDEITTLTRRFQQKIDDLEHDLTSLQRKHKTLEGDFAAVTQECSGLKSTVAQMTSAQAGMKAQLESTEMNLQQSLEAGKLKDQKIAHLEETLANRDTTIQEKEARIRENEGVRRKLHNTIQELKGNIRVFCRVRPLLGEECAHGEEIQHINFPDDDGKILEMDRIADVSLNESTLNNTRRGGNGNNGNKYEFQFDKVFTQTSQQQDVFEEISQLVQSSLDGYNVCIFAYGQTGSGKTYTMEGPDDPDDETMGMIPRAVDQVFATAADLQDKGWQYELEASFVEIYNETIRDLLGKNDNQKHDVKMVDKKSNEVEVTNLHRPIVSTQSEVAVLLKKASHNRAVAATNCNERSSRSHSVFCLKISGKNTITQEHCQGTLNLVDLAGSERLSQSGSTGDRLRETKCINKSLSNLGNVIMALGNKESHIPYRNSKLTHMLQNSLGGNSKTLMFVNVSPKEENFQESLCSLRFATKVNQTNIGTAQKKVK